ncbi:hypothetical protein [Neisseria sp. Ec49-e6-T10]|uniref:hypothetical protein n=1 Tax=Neisseria sp. Ec49-e6-T10 TaxID=3140744 RepID=UPI003EC14807
MKLSPLLSMLKIQFKKIINYIPISRTLLTFFLACILLVFSGFIGESFNEFGRIYYFFGFYILIQCILIFYQKKYWQWRVVKIIFWSCYFISISYQYANKIEDFQENALNALIKMENFQSIHGYYPEKEEFASFISDRFKNGIMMYPRNSSGLDGLGVPIKNYTKGKVILPPIAHDEITKMTVMFYHPSIPFHKCYFHRVKRQWLCWGD